MGTNSPAAGKSEPPRAGPAGNKGKGPKGQKGQKGQRAGKKNAAAAPAVEPSDAIVEQLLAMGFTMGGSIKACIGCHNKGRDEAMEYYWAHEADSGFHDEPAPEPEPAGGPAEGGDRPKKPRKVRRTVLELQRLFAELQLSARKSVGTERLTGRAFEFKPGDAAVQHDAQELIVKLLDKLELELRPDKAKGPAAASGPGGGGGPAAAAAAGQARLIADLFEYQSRTELVCGACGATSGPPVETNKSLFVPVKGFRDVPAALAETFRAETRRTDCDSPACGGAKRDKACSLAVRRLPPLLWCVVVVVVAAVVAVVVVVAATVAAATAAAAAAAAATAAAAAAAAAVAVRRHCVEVLVCARGAAAASSG